MTETVVGSATREVVIGFDRPFVIIGERINPTGRKVLAAEMKIGDYSRVTADAIAQVEAGAHMLDVNAGIPLADEPAILAEAVRLVQQVTDVPLSIDSSIVAALEAGLGAYRGKALVNSVTGEEDRLESVLPLVAKHGAAVVAISNDETGISEDPDVRFEVARKIVERAADHGIPKSDVVVDPLVMPIGAINSAGAAGDAHRSAPARRTGGEYHLRRIQREFRVAEPGRHQQRLSDHGHRRRPHIRHHQPLARRSDAGGAWRGRYDGPGSGLRAMDPQVPRTLSRRGHGRSAAGTGSPPPGLIRQLADALAQDRRALKCKKLMGQDTSAKVVFTPSGRRGSFPVGTPVLQAAQQLGVDIASICGGRGLCGRCQILCGGGRVPKTRHRL